MFNSGGKAWERVALVFAKPQPLLLGRRMRTGQKKGKQRVGLTYTSNEEERKVGMGPEEEVGTQARKSDSPTCRSEFQQRSWPWSLWAVRSRQSRTAWSPRESSPGCWRAWHLMAEGTCKNRQKSNYPSNHAIHVDDRMRAGHLQHLWRPYPSPSLHCHVNIHVGKCENPYSGTKEHVYIRSVNQTKWN